VQEAFGASATRLVQNYQRLVHQVVLDDHALDEASHLVGTAATACGNDPFYRLGRLPLSMSNHRSSEGSSNSCSQGEGTSAGNRLHSVISFIFKIALTI